MSAASFSPINTGNCDLDPARDARTPGNLARGGGAPALTGVYLLFARIGTAQAWPSWRGSLSSTLSQDTWLLVHM
jgi:hypothetical protein